MSALRQRLARAIYSALLLALTPLYLLRLWRRGAAEPRYRRRIAERFGYHAPVARAPLTVWVHAVSLGETQAAATLISALRQREPLLRLLLTCGTATGWDAGKRLLREGDLHTWLPYDTPFAVRRFLNRLRPDLGVVMETEVWPNLMHEARKRGLPMVLANARLSDKSQRHGLRLADLIRPALQGFTKVLAQTSDDAQRLSALGAPHVSICGNLKFDVEPVPALLDQGRTWRAALDREVVLAASTRVGEEAALLTAWTALAQPRPLLLIVPRHPQRFDEVATLVQQQGLRLARRSHWGVDPDPQAAEADVWLGDSLGEMPLYYAAADVALLGGSFEPLGGQNLIEAAACGCPVLMGPHTFNFAQAAELSLAARASLRVVDMAQGVQQAASMAFDPLCQAWSARALAFAQAHRGATARSVDHLLALLPR